MSSKVAIITGARRGIGRAIATTLAGEGYDIAVHDVEIDELALQTEESVRALGRECLLIEADLEKSDAAKSLVKSTADQFGRIDVLVNNAGLGGTAGTVGHGEEARIPRGQCIAYPAELFPSCFGIGRKEFETDAQRRLRAHGMTLFDTSQRDSTPAAGVVLGS